MSSLIQPSQGLSGAPATSAPPKPGSARRPRTQPAATAAAKSEAPVSLDTVPSSPPPEVLEQVRAAGRAYEQLQSQGLEVRYSHDPASRKTTATLHDRSGALLRTLSPSEAVKLAQGGAPPEG